ncbi:MAG: hypothetical protein Kow00120_24950 [Anaerolineae bacterium]
MDTIHTNAFYNAVAADYHLFFRDWWATVEREAVYLDKLLSPHGVRTVLDASCGPGTQSIALAGKGYAVTAADPSAALLDRARANAQQAGVEVTLLHASFLDLPAYVDGPFDALITTGNSFAHLLDDAEIAQALANFHGLLAPGGVLLVGIRDFDAILEARPRFLPGQIHDEGDERVIGFDIWDYNDGPPPTITFNKFFVRGDGEAWVVTHAPVVYRALREAELCAFLERAGFVDTERADHWWEMLLVSRRGKTKGGGKNVRRRG